MEVLYGLLIAFHVLVSALLIVAVLLQPGRGGGGIGAVFGGGSSTSVFGGRGATTFLSKATGVLAALFFAFSVAIALTGSERSVTDEAPAGAPQPAPLSAPPAPMPE
jgi:preprotein translocase subunit SecG